MMTQVERIELAPGLEASRMLTGLWQVADMERDGSTVDASEAAKAMERYVDVGLTTFDMADHYGSAEVIAGQLDRSRPGDAQLLTKWVPRPGPITLADARKAVELALRRMQRDRLDLLQFHAWNYADPSYLDGLEHLRSLQQEGLIAHLGLTNVDSAHLNMLLKSGTPIRTNQICYSLLDQRARGPMTEVCEAHGVRILAFGTLAGGFLTERWLGKSEPTALQTWSQMKYKRFIDAAGGWSKFQRLLSVLNGVAEGLGVSIANVATRAILDAPSVGGVIVGARLGERAHIEDNLRVFDIELDQGSRQAIANAVAELDPIPGDCGDEYRKPPFLTASGDLSHHLESFPAPFETRPGPHGRMQAKTGTHWEAIAGFSRAVRVGDRILISGTTATHRDRVVGGQDPYAQAVFCFDKVEGALQSLGGTLEDVVRTRIYVADPALWEPVSRAHGERFGAIQPANTLVQAEIIGGDYLVEIEAEAVISA